MFFEIYGGGGAKPCLILPALPFLCDRKFLSHKMLRKDAHLAEMKNMLRIPLGRERVASDSF